jgi:hypothetical protein
MIEISIQALESPAHLAGRFAHVTARPFEDEQLTYEVLLPEGSGANPDLEPRETAPHEPLRIGHYPHPVEGARFDVALYRPGCEVSLIDFLDHLRERLGLVIESADPVVYWEREGVDALVRAGRGPAERIVRMCLFRHGDAIARLGGIAPPEIWEQVADDFAVSLSTCRFLRRTDEAFLEPFDFTRAGGTIPLGVRHPRRWRVREPDGLGWGRAALELRWIERNDTRALLRLDAIDPASAEGVTLAGAARLGEEALWASGLAEAQVTEQAASRLLGGPEEKHAQSFRIAGRAFGADAEVLLSAVRRGDVYYSIATAGPARAVDPIAWMAVRRVHEVAVLSLNAPDETFLLPVRHNPAAAGDEDEDEDEERRTEEAEASAGGAPETPEDIEAALDALGLDPAAAKAEIDDFVRSIDPEIDLRLLQQLEQLGVDLDEL